MNSIQPGYSFVSQPSAEARIDFDRTKRHPDRDGSLPAFRPVVHRFAVHNVTKRILTNVPYPFISKVEKGKVIA